jgi:nucleoside-diphosphate-sugar epimerase
VIDFSKTATLSGCYDLVITGAGGWFGSAACSLFEENSLGYKGSLAVVLGPTDSKDIENRWSRFAKVLRLDLSKPNDFDLKAKNIIHAAGIIHPKSKLFSNPFEVNVDMMRQVVNLIPLDGTIVFVSSFAAGSSAASYPRSSQYGVSKLAAENLLRTFAHKNNSGLRGVILRPCWFYGPNSPARQQKFDRLCQKGLFPVFKKGNVARSVSFVDDVVFAAFSALNLPSPDFPVYYVSDPHNYSYLDIVSKRSKLGKKAPSFPIFIPNLARFFDGVLQSLGLYVSALHVLGEAGFDLAPPLSEVLDHRSTLNLPKSCSFEDNLSKERG